MAADLDACVALSRTEPGRKHLVGSGVHVQVAQQISQPSCGGSGSGIASSRVGDAARRSEALREDGCAAASTTLSNSSDSSDVVLLQQLRLLRNLCVAGSGSCEQMAAAGLLHSVCCVMCTRTSSSPPGLTFAQLCAQLLSNFVQSVPNCADAVWQHAFPGPLSQVAKLPAGTVHEPLCSLLMAVARGSTRVAGELASQRAGQLWEQLLGQAVGNAGVAAAPESLGLLLRHLGLQRGLLQQLFEGLAPALQPALLQITAHVLEVEGLSPAGGGADRADVGAMQDAARFLAILPRQLCSGCLAAVVKSEDDLRTHCLRDSLNALRLLAALPPGALGLPPDQDLAWYTCTPHGGHLPLHLLAMLAALPQISHHGRQQQPLQLDDAVAVKAAGCPSQQPYVGYRRDVVAVVANLVYQRPDVQQEVVEFGGVELLLSQCHIDETSPMVKEWALLAVRNLTETCQAAHERISQLTAQGMVQSDELSKAGVQLEMDAVSGKFRTKIGRDPRVGSD